MNNEHCIGDLEQAEPAQQREGGEVRTEDGLDVMGWAVCSFARSGSNVYTVRPKYKHIHVFLCL